ncbi:uncharacterized protein LOC135935885 [Cloeon dipterum]|uniref:uncharacterized protein LOC135935885 n=1 Tax=Cloeon dipterum TaxID=197152 RepID=UPI00321FDC95
MNNFFTVIVLLGLTSLATAANFTQVFEWPNGLDYEWPSEASRTQAMNDGTFKPENIIPHFMAVFGSRIFLSLNKFNDIPVTLVTLPTSSTSSESPKLTPFPSWDFHGKGDCNKIEVAKGMQVDAVGRLWVLDSGSSDCKAKIWTTDLSKNNDTKLIHRFSFNGWMYDLAIDETPRGTFAYISRWNVQNIVVFSLERNQSWVVDTPGVKVYSFALSPKDQEPRQLFLGEYNSTELYSIPVDALRSGTLSAMPKIIGKWTAIKPHRMLMDNHGTIYAENKYRYRLLKAAIDTNFQKTGGNFPAKKSADESTNSALVGSLAFFLVLSCIINLWLYLRKRNLLNSNEQRDAGAEETEMPVLPNPVSPEIVHEEIENDLYGVVTAPPTRPRF